MSGIYSDVQTLEPGDEVVLFDFDARPITGGGAGDVQHFHGYTQLDNIVWKGIVYKPWPCMTEGFERTSDQQPTPTFTIGNIDGSISSLCQSFQDLLGAILTVHRTLGKYLDGQPGADPSQEFPPDVWYVERKALESSDVVKFELANAIDFAGAIIPSRIVQPNLCGWIPISGYRGPDCGYTGGPVADINDNPTSDSALDDCSGRLRACKLRFGEHAPLPYGGFPASGLVRS